jgi:acetyltransferase-like isoleucine patch superfamily enzyme
MINFQWSDMAGFSHRIGAFWRTLRDGSRTYSTAAYLLGLLLPGRYSGSGPVAWLRGFPRPEVLPGEGRIQLGHVGLYPGVKLHCAGQGQLNIGDGTFLNRSSRVFCGERVEMGRDCMISWQATVTDSLGDGQAPGHFAPVYLGDHVWLGARVVVLGGTRLGAGCIVAAGSVVQGEYPAGSVLAGRPAEVVS